MIRDATPPTPPEHLDDEVLVALACNELTAAETEAVQRHLAGCEECSEVWRAVETMQAAAVEFDPGAVKPQRFSPPRGGSRWLALAAAAVLALVVLSVPRWSNHQEQEADSLALSEVVRSGVERWQLTSPREGERTDAPQFAWVEIEGAAEYRVELVDSLGVLVWSSEAVEKGALDWPLEAGLEPGVYYWRVVGFFEDGLETQVSPIQRFEWIAP